MWVREENGAPVEVIISPRTLNIGEWKYPRALFTLWSSNERNAIGIFDAVIDERNAGQFKTPTGTPHTWPKVKEGNVYKLVRTYSDWTRQEFILTLKAQARNLVLTELTERTNTNWNTYKDAVRTRAGEIIAAYDAGTPVSISTGSIDGTGSWPT